MIESPSGFWGPVVWIITAVVALLIAYFIRRRGEKAHKKGVQGEPFLMGNPSLSEGETHVRAHNIYWGFFEGLRKYYDPTVTAHTGIINDYIIWLTVITALVMIILFVAGGV
ncbi:MAG: hydrogenase [Dehalococcoidia bacterium]|nr:hydrogenase [Dehalococcoidia bacterium]